MPPFNASLPFVSNVYRYVEQRQLGEAIRFLETYLKRQPASPLHWLVGRDFRKMLPSYSKWLLKCCQRIPQPGSYWAVHTGLGELEINAGNWRADASVYPDYQDTPNPYAWMAESFEDCQLLGEPWDVPGLQPLGKAYQFADEYDDLDPRSKPPISAETVTAVSYLFFLRFLELNRDTHRIAGERGNPLGRCHLFCTYGDLVYHSRPKRIRHKKK